MNDELDPGLKRLFASTAEHPADEAFVAAVSARTGREPRLPATLRRLAAAALPTLVLAGLAAAVGVTLQQSAPLLTDSLMGIAAGLGLTLAGVVCIRLLAPLAGRRF